MPSLAPVDEPVGQEYLHTVGEGRTRSQEVVECHLPAFHEASFLKVASCHVECKRQDKHRQREMVGHDGRQHDMRKRIEKHGEQRGIRALQSDYLAERAADKQETVEHQPHQEERHDEDSAVMARDAHQPVVELRQWP